MNEQIQNILSENGTKTSKIQKLLALGLTRRQVADLVANGNYGFVQNVYMRMMQGLTNTAAQAAATIAPAIDYIFNRNFGVEIEAYNCTRDRLARELTAAGISVQVEGYNHTDHADHWKLVTDSSLRGDNTFELVSPILNGEQGLEELAKHPNIYRCHSAAEMILTAAFHEDSAFRSILRCLTTRKRSRLCVCTGQLPETSNSEK